MRTFAAVILAIQLGIAASSSNGLNYACDTQTLQDQNLCVFVAAGDALAAGEVMAPSVVNREVGGVGERMVVDKTGNQLRLSMRPWGNLVAEAAAPDGGITGNEWLYLLSYELLVPLRNAMMFDPSSVTTDATEWAKLTKVFVDCHVKTATEPNTPFDKFSTNDIYDVIKNPQALSPGPSVHNAILQYIEEGSADLWCAMTGVLLSDSHCPHVWESNGMVEGENSECWHAAYDGLYGAGAAAAALGTDTGGDNGDGTDTGGDNGDGTDTGGDSGDGTDTGGDNSTDNGGDTMTCGEVKELYRSNGCCGMPTKPFELDSRNTRRLSSMSDSNNVIAELEQALQTTMSKGGKEKAMQLAKKIQGLLTPYNKV